MKKGILVFLTVLLLAALALCAGCSSPDADYIYFQNDLDAKVDGFYISSVSSDEWGEKLNLAPVGAGGNIHIDPDKLVDGLGVAYDIGAIDETGMGYDVYDVVLDVNDTIALSVDGEDAIITVTSPDGSSEVYYGWAEMQEDDR